MSVLANRGHADDNATSPFSGIGKAEMKIMGVNADKPQRWKEDIARSVDFYNEWFLRFAPKAYRETRKKTTAKVESALKWTRNLRDISPSLLREHPEMLQMLRMATAPPIARDRLIGLAGVSKNLVSSMEDRGKVPLRIGKDQVERELTAIGTRVALLADVDIFPWLESKKNPTNDEVYRAATIVADRLCGAIAKEVVRAERKIQQLSVLSVYLDSRGYREVFDPGEQRFDLGEPGTYTFFTSLPAAMGKHAFLPMDALIHPTDSRPDGLPVLILAESHSSFQEATRNRDEHFDTVHGLRMTYGDDVPFALMLGGYFGADYLGTQAAEGVDWIWQHRLDDLSHLGI
jgi:hypothetical protein